MILAAAVTAGALILGVPAGDSPGARRSCEADRGRIVAISPVSRITAMRVAGTPAWFACLDSRGQRRLLGVQDSPDEEVGRPLLAGSYVAYEYSEIRAGAPGPEAIVSDLASRRQASITVDGGITGMVLSSRGDLIATSPDGVQHARPVGRGRSLVTLDEGEIGPGSLALSPNGRRAYWLNGGQPRSFAVPRGRAARLAASRARSCTGRSGRERIVAITPQSRIVVSREDETRVWYACLNRGGRRVFLGVEEPPDRDLGRPRLAGSYVAYEESVLTALAPGPEAILRDLRSRRRWAMTVEGEITGMVLSSRGDLIATGPDSVLHLRRGRAVAKLDEGEIAPGSLALSRNGRYAYWLNGGQPRSFVLPR